MKFAGLAAPIILSSFLLACSGRSSDEPLQAAAATATPVASSPAATASPAPLATGPAEFEGVRALEHVRVLSKDIGPRVAGTDAEDATVDYIATQFRSYGYDVELMPFTYEGDRFNRVATLTLAAGDVEGLALVGSAAGTLTAASVWVDLADDAGIAGRDLSGNIAVAARGSISFAQKYENVKAAGATALVIVNNEPGPVSGDLRREASIPVIAVAGEAMEQVQTAAAAGETLTVEAPGDELSESQDVIARPAAGAVCTVIVGGHHDTVPAAPGANDNGSGTATVIELARAFAADGKLDDGLCFVTFGAEESGLYGSQALATKLQTDGQLPRYMVNVDVAGIGNGVAVTASAGLGQRVVAHAQDLSIDATIAELPANTGSDHISFRQLGVPVVFVWSNGAFPTIHTPDDVFEDVQVDELERVGDLDYRVIADFVAEVARG